MIKKLRAWIADAVQAGVHPVVAVPEVVRHGTPQMTIYKIGNGYLVHKQDTRQYREDHPTVIFCVTPLDVARQIINGEALEKLGIKVEAEDPAVNLHTHGYVTGKLAGTVRPKPYNPNSDI